MGNISQSIIGVFKKAGKGISSFPAVILNAALFTVVSIIRIMIDWPAQEASSFLLSCLSLSFGLGTIFSLAAVTYSQSKANTKQSFLMANLLGLTVTVVTFVLLYFFGGILPEKAIYEGANYTVLHPLMGPRVWAAGIVSFLAFIIFAGASSPKSDFSKALFMTIKSFFIALVYSLVIIAGASGVAGAIQALLYQGLSFKVYELIAAVAGFIGFTIFIGNFPDFRKDNEDPHREAAETPSRFVAVLLEYILVPIMLALTVVLILWAGRTITGGMNTEFTRLYGIAAAYAIGGILLHILVTHSQSGSARLYKRLFPIAVLFILLFEAWALYLQLNRFGLKPTEYLFLVIWIIALVSAVLLIVKKAGAHQVIAIITGILIIISVLPFIGYGDLPVTAQVKRLETMLEKANMLKDNRIVPASPVPDLKTREEITDSVDFLIGIPAAVYPQWLNKEELSKNFDQIMGFTRAFPNYQSENPQENPGTYLFLKPQVINISGYQWDIGIVDEGQNTSSVSFTGTKGIYTVELTGVGKGGSSSNLKLSRDGKVLIEKDLSEFFDSLKNKYPEGKQTKEPALEDMSLKFDSPEAEILIIFNNIEIYTNSQTKELTYNYSIRSILLNEK